jgi:hypothetical protein
MISNSQQSTDAHPLSKGAFFLVLYNDLDSSIGRFYTFLNFGNYHKFSFPINGENMPPIRFLSRSKCAQWGKASSKLWLMKEP